MTFYNNFQCIDTIPWPTHKDEEISREYPFTDTANETPDITIVRTYLQFLWLPESLMPLRLLIPSLERVNVASSTSLSSPHPLHDLLKPLLLSSRAVSGKYHTELPAILNSGGGEGEVEETMMWYALHHEKADEDPDAKLESPDDPWSSSKWRSKWFDRLERREVQIQILLNMHLLSLPGPPPPLEMSSVQRRKTPKAEQTRMANAATERRLETLMDKLNVWGLMGDVELGRSRIDSHHTKDELDWIQLFSKDVVESQFRTSLPDLCDLLASKVNKRSPFSDEEEEEERRHDTRPLSPERPAKRPRTMSSRASPEPSTSRQTSLKPPPPRAPLDRSRSRSLSLSLAQERERAASEGPLNKRKPLNREISMSRTFKPKPKKSLARTDSMSTQPAPKKKVKETGVTLVQGTPVKQRTLSVSMPGMMLARHRPQKEEIWELPDSSDVLLLKPMEDAEMDGSPKRKRRK